MVKNYFSINLKRIRRQKGLSQRDLANKCGVSQRIIAHYETNAINPSLSKIQIIAKTLDVTIYELLKNTKQSKSEEFKNIDIKTLKRLKQIANLTPQERNSIYMLLDSILDKKQKKVEKKLMVSKK